MVNYINRIIIDLKSRLLDEVYWHDRMKRKTILVEFAKKEFSKCVVLINCTMISKTSA